MQRKAAAICLGFLAAALLASELRASSVGLGLNFATVCSQTTTGATAAVCNSNSSGNGVFQGSATAEASDGYFTADAFAQYTVANNTEMFVGGSAGADAQLQDTLFLSQAPSSGFLQFNFYLTGTFVQDSGANPSVFLFLGAVADVDGVSGTALSWDTNLIFPGPYSVNVPYSNLSPSITLDVESSTGQSIATDPAVTTYTGEVAFSGPVQINVLDSNQRIVPGAVIESASGHNYEVIESVPEPGMAWLLTLACLAFAVLKQKTLCETNGFRAAAVQVPSGTV